MTPSKVEGDLHVVRREKKGHFESPGRYTYLNTNTYSRNYSTGSAKSINWTNCWLGFEDPNHVWDTCTCSNFNSCSLHTSHRMPLPRDPFFCCMKITMGEIFEHFLIVCCEWIRIFLPRG